MQTAGKSCTLSPRTTTSTVESIKMNSEQLAKAIVLQKTKEQQAKKSTEKKQKTKKKKNEKKVLTEEERQAKAHKRRILDEFKRLRKDPNKRIYEAILVTSVDEPVDEFQRGLYSVYWEDDVLPKLSRHYSGPNTDGAIFYLLAVIDALKTCPQDKALVLSVREKSLVKLICPGGKLEGTFEKYQEILKPYIETIYAILGSRKLPVIIRNGGRRIERFINSCEERERRVMLPPSYDADSDSSESRTEDRGKLGPYLLSERYRQDQEDIERWIQESDDRPLKVRRMQQPKQQQPSSSASESASTQEKGETNVSLAGWVKDLVKSFIPGLSA